MATYAAFLRGMNVGGHRLTNDELRAHFAAIEFDDVATFRASGNVVFTAAQGSETALQKRIEDELEQALGYAVPTFLRDRRELRAIAARTPFSEAALKASKGKLQVAMLAVKPSRTARAAVLKLAGEEDLLDVGARELYWLPSAGVLDSPLDMKAIDKLIGPMTMRTIGTVEAIAGRYFAD
jgi:uncharacterized protein (DUF1697 family)